MQFKHVTAAEERGRALLGIFCLRSPLLVYTQFLTSSVFIQYWYAQWLQNCEYVSIRNLTKVSCIRMSLIILSKQGPRTDMATQRSGLLWRCTDILTPWRRYLKYSASLKLSTFWVFLINRDELLALSCWIFRRLPRKNHNSGKVFTLEL